MGNISGAGAALIVKSFGFTSQGVSAGTFYKAGFYNAPAADANLSQAATTVTLGAANALIGAHAFAVVREAGAAASGQVELRITGASIANDGTRNGADSEIIIADITTPGANDYFQSTKRWIGTVTWELNIASGAPATYSLDFNYGLAKFDNAGALSGVIDVIEVVGLAGANETGFDIELIHHKLTGWAYSAAAFVPGPTILAQLTTDVSPDDELVNGEDFAWLHTGLNQAIDSLNGEGVIIRITTTSNNAVESMDIHLSGSVRE